MIPVKVSVGSDRTRLMDIPGLIEVLGQAYLVEVVEDPHVGLGRADHADTAAAMTELQRGFMRIRGNAEQSEDCMRDTVLHETLHCVSHLAGLDLEEETIAPLAAALLQVLRANPELVACLVS